MWPGNVYFVAWSGSPEMGREGRADLPPELSYCAKKMALLSEINLRNQ